MSALDYCLKANLYGLLFAGCYWLFLRRHTFLHLNRTYLLLSTVLSLALPLASLPTETAQRLPSLDWPVPVGVMALPVSSVIATAPVEPTGPDWTLLGAWAYSLIAFGLLRRLAIQTSRLIRLIRQSERQVRDGYVLVLPRDQTTPTFSFFRYVVLNPADVHNELILSHELVHVRQHHSADVLGVALLRTVFWPVIALAFVERALRHIHEFLADRAASGRATNGSQANYYQPNYAKFLVEYTFGVRPEVLTNGFFNPSLLKQRILMLHQRATNRWALGKYALVLPLTLGLLAMTTAREKITAVVTQTADETITVWGKVTGADSKPLRGATVIVKGTNVGTSTDTEGRYILFNVSRDASVVVSFVGFANQTIPVKGRNEVNIVLTRAAVLNEVVVIAYEYLPKATPLPSATTSPSRNGDVYTVVEQVPEFPGGMSALGQYMARSLRYPARAQRANVKGRVFVQFVVTETGTVQDLRILKGIGFGCDEEAVRVVSRMPNWIPGKQNGKPVAVMYNLPIQFELEKRVDKRTGQSTAPSSKTFNAVVNNHPNARFALYDDLDSKRFVHPDSNPAVRPDSGRRFGITRRPFRLNQIKTEIRNPIPYSMRGEAELFLVNGTKQVDRFEDVSPDDIDYIEVNKEEKTIAEYRKEYGEKAAKGVVIIHLKSAKAL